MGRGRSTSVGRLRPFLDRAFSLDPARALILFNPPTFAAASCNYNARSRPDERLDLERTMRQCSLSALVACLLIGGGLVAQDRTQYDVVVYGGTSGGVAAAVQVRRMGKSVVLIEPSKHLG